MNNRVGEIAQQFVMEANVAHPPAAQAAGLANVTATPKRQSQSERSRPPAATSGTDTATHLEEAHRKLDGLVDPPAPPASGKDSAVAAGITAGAGRSGGNGEGPIAAATVDKVGAGGSGAAVSILQGILSNEGVESLLSKISYS